MLCLDFGKFEVKYEGEMEKKERKMNVNKK